MGAIANASQMLIGHKILEESRHGRPDCAVVHEDAAGEDHQETPNHERTKHTHLDLVGGNLQQDADCGRDGLHVVAPVDVLDTLNHEHAHHDERRTGGERRD